MSTKEGGCGRDARAVVPLGMSARVMGAAPCRHEREKGGGFGFERGGGGASGVGTMEAGGQRNECEDLRARARER